MLIVKQGDLVGFPYFWVGHQLWIGFRVWIPVCLWSHLH